MQLKLASHLKRDKGVKMVLKKVCPVYKTYPITELKMHWLIQWHLCLYRGVIVWSFSYLLLSVNRGVPAYTQSTQLRTLIFECLKNKNVLNREICNKNMPNPG